MDSYKIIFTGPVGAGKTTAVSTISDVEPVLTEEDASDVIKEIKPQTTVAMDYGLMKLNNNKTVHLYGTPGQEKFNFMWDILSKGGSGLIILINNSAPNPFADLKLFLSSFSRFTAESRVVIGINRTHENSSPSISDYHLNFGDIIKKIPIFEIDTREYSDIALLIEALLFSIEPDLEG